MRPRALKSNWKRQAPKWRSSNRRSSVIIQVKSLPCEIYRNKSIGLFFGILLLYDVNPGLCGDLLLRAEIFRF